MSQHNLNTETLHQNNTKTNFNLDKLKCLLENLVDRDTALYATMQMLIDREKIGLWCWHIETDHVYFNSHFSTLWGIDVDCSNSIPFDYWLIKIHVDDRNYVEHELKQSYEDGTEFELEYRVMHSGNFYKKVLSKGKKIDFQGPMMCGATWQI